MSENLDAFLAQEDSKPSRRCICCNTPALNAILERFLNKVRDGETDVPLTVLFEKHIRKNFDKPRCIDAVRNHIRNCMKRVIATGKERDA